MKEKKKPIVEIKDVWLSIKGKLILEAVDLRLEEGDYLGLIGPNGGGKTTLLRVMLGLLSPHRGTREFLARNPPERGAVSATSLQYTRFDANFPMSVLDVLLMGRIAARGLLRRGSEGDRDVALSSLDKVEMTDEAGRQNR